jgi:hypothetical protein
MWSLRWCGVPRQVESSGARSTSECRQPPTRIREQEMKYLCLAYEQESKLAAMPREQWQALREETLAYVEQIRRSGHLLDASPLQTVRSAATVRVRNGQLSATDGPFAETKEQLGGFFMIEARDLNEAIQIAGRWPSARIGSIEVRPVADDLPQEGRYASA